MRVFGGSGQLLCQPGVITPGTLLAVFLATSDEAIPLLAAEPTLWNKLGLLLVLKIVFGIAAGLVLDVPLRRILPKGLYARL